MYQYKGIEDTIAAISTASGVGGIGIVRLSGTDAVTIASEMFAAKSGKEVKSFISHKVYYGWIKDKTGEIVDEVLLTIMKAPFSYTTEDVVEISSHGGVVVQQVILKRTIELGARLADAGEFTKRAFLSGRIDLTQAEAVIDIISSKTDKFLRISTHQLKGELARELDNIRSQLMDIFTHIEAVINFPEDDVDDAGRKEVLLKIESALKDTQALLASSDQGLILKDGIKIVICGRANVGKSSLLNILLKAPRAIVSSVAGTTRDTIEETAHIKGIPVQLVDTAGILEPRDLIEEEAIERSRMHMKAADLVLLVLDASQDLSDEDKALIEYVKDIQTIIVLNKVDLPSKISDKTMEDILGDVIQISVLKNKGIDHLQNTIVDKVSNGVDTEDQGITVSNLRHITSLEACYKRLVDGKKTILEGTSLEFISDDIKCAINDLDNITGRNIDDDLLDTIFSKFCIGK